MHWRAHSDHMRDLAVYDGPGGVVAAVRDELADRVDAMLAAGIDRDRIVLDPGLGFAKTAEHNWAAAARPRRDRRRWAPGAGGGEPQVASSATLLADRDGAPRPVDEREYAGTALTVLLARAGSGACACTTYAPTATRCGCSGLRSEEHR